MLLHFFNNAQSKQASEFDVKNITPANFSFIVRNIPKDALKDKDMEAEIKFFFTENGKGNGAINIKKINLCYDYRDKILLDKMLDAKAQQYSKYNGLRNQGKQVNEDKINEIKQEIKLLDEKIKELEISFTNGNFSKFLGIAIITCNTEEEKRDVLKKWQTSTMRRILERFKKSSPYKWYDNVLDVSQAPEPSEIYWENLRVGTLTKSFYRLLIFLSTSILLVICFFFCLCFSFLQRGKAKDAENATDGESVNYVLIDESISTASSFIILILNFLLNLTITKISQNFSVYLSFVYHTTWTKYDAHLAKNFGIVKLFFYLLLFYENIQAKFINTAFMALFIAIGTNTWWNKGNNNETNILLILLLLAGLIPTIFSVLRSNAIIPIILDIIDASWIFRWWKRKSIRKQGKNCGLTQEQANFDRAFEEPTIDLSIKYAAIINTMFTTLFYASILPLGLIWSIIGLTGFYWTEKVQEYYHRFMNYQLRLDLQENLLKVELLDPNYQQI